MVNKVNVKNQFVKTFSSIKAELKNKQEVKLLNVKY